MKLVGKRNYQIPIEYARRKIYISAKINSICLGATECLEESVRMLNVSFLLSNTISVTMKETEYDSCWAFFL